MGEFLWVFFGLIVVSGLLYLVITVVFGPGEERSAAEPDSRPMSVPQGRILSADDIEKIRLPVAFRGYRMTEVDALLDRIAEELAIRDALSRAPQHLPTRETPQTPDPGTDS